MYTLVYPVIESDWGEEFKYSLRSIDANLKTDYRVIVYGTYKPKWLDDSKVEFILFPKQKTGSYKVPETQFNQGLIYKDLIARNDIDDFVFFNDDIYLLKETDTLDTVYVVDNRLFMYQGEKSHRNTWKKALVRTRRCSYLDGFTSCNFETHLPYLINTDKMSTLTEVLEGTELLATRYYNKYPPEMKLARCGAVKISCHSELAVDSCLEEFKLKSHMWFNHNDDGLNAAKVILPKMFPDKSRFEC